MQGDLTGLVLDDRYLLQERLGAGGMGEVWRCRDQRIGRDVAVKLLIDLRLSDEAVARFEREARVAGGLSSPLIVTLHDYGHGDLNGRDVPYLVMELLQGRTLAGIGNDERNPRRVLTWGAQVCAALEAAHQAGVVHRDIKPSNVMVTADGGLKVLDFGIARVAEEGSSRGPLTADGTVMGTAEYMSPEQAAGRPADARSDLYSFGCLLYFLVTARPPFQTESFFATLQLQLNGTPEPPSKYRPGLPPELDQLILQLLAKDPAARPAGARAVRETLEAMIPPPKDAGKADAVAAATAATATAGDVAGPEFAATLKDQDAVPTAPGLNAGAGNQAAAAVAPMTPVPPQSGPPRPATPHQPMAPLTHPPTHVGPTSETRMVPEEFGGPATPGAGTGSTTQDPKKPGTGISRRKLLLGVGGVAGIAAVGGGVAFALGGKDSGTTDHGSQPRVGSNVAATDTVGATSATSATSSASSADSPTDGSSSSDAATSASPSPSSAAGSQPPLAPGGSPIGHLEIAGQPAMSIMFMNNGKSLVVADDKNGVQIFDVTNPAGAHKVSSIDPPLSNGQLQPLNTLDYSAKRSMLALGGTGGLALWDVTDPAKPFQLCARSDVNGKKVNNVAFNSDSTKLLVATNNPDYYSDNPNGSCVLDITDPRNPAQWSGLTPSGRDTLNTAYFTRDDKYIVSTGYGDDNDNAIYQLWDSKDLHNVNPVDSTPWWTQGGGTMKLGSALWIAFAGPWHMLVVGVVRADTKRQDLQFLDFGNPLSPVKQWYVQNTSGAVAFHPTRPIVAIGDSRSGATTVYDMTDPVHPTTVTRLVADAGAVEQVVFTPDGSTLAVAVRKDGYEENAMVYFWKM